MAHLFESSESARLLHKNPFLLNHELNGGTEFDLTYYRARAVAKTLRELGLFEIRT